MHDVVIVGGGPAGSTCASVLRKYAKDIDVLVLEREIFPRDHVGESLLPPISNVLNEIGCWDKIEAANFPIKIGATYKWGRTPELWDFEFYPASFFKDEPRPAKFTGQRRYTAFQVDRSKYDKILLDHAESLGATVRQNAKVVRAEMAGDEIKSVHLDSGEQVSGQYFVDASGHGGVLRRALGVGTQVATSLQNIAIWDYWENADWAIEIGVGGTRVQVMSLGYGWIWFIPLGPTRTSVGLVIPATYYKESKQRPADLYQEAIANESRISALMKNATSEGKLQTTKDWSFVADRHAGKNWLLAGESGGFADPILAAGLTVTHYSARESAITLIELMRGRHDPEWLLSEYDARQKARILNHIRFADYWYTANSQFTQLKEFTAEIAADNGLSLAPEKAWDWLGRGGFIDADANLGPAGFSIDQVKNMGEFLLEVKSDSLLKTCNVFRLNLEGAEWKPRASYASGQVKQTSSYVRGKRVLPLTGICEFVFKLLQTNNTTQAIADALKTMIQQKPDDRQFLNEYVGRVPHALEAMALDGWVTASYDPALPLRDLPETVARILKWNEDSIGV